MPKRIKDNRPETIYCACGCGEIIPKKKYQSQQNYYINTHQHRGKNNGNYKGGKGVSTCAVCGKEFDAYECQNRVTCGNHDCYIQWQRLTTVARGRNKIETSCAHCGKPIHRYPSLMNETNFCDLFCMAKYYPKRSHLNGNWKGGRWKYVRDQVAKRDNNACVICGFNYSLNVHHITPVADGGQDAYSNLITLCPNHHAMVHSGVIDVEHLRNYEWEPDIKSNQEPHNNHLHARSQ